MVEGAEAILAQAEAGGSGLVALMAAAKELTEQIIAAGGALARVLAAALGASTCGASRHIAAAMVAAAWREKPAAADFQGECD